MTVLGLFLNNLTGIKNQKETAFSYYKLLQVTAKKYIFAQFSKLCRHWQLMVLWYNNPHMEVTGKDIIKEQENKRKNIT